MWTYLWAFVAVCLGIYALYMHMECNYYSGEYAEEVRKDAKYKLNKLKDLLSVLCNPHPEDKIIASVAEAYDAPFFCYDIYGDGRIVIDQTKVIRPNSEDDLKRYGIVNADLLWLYIELYRDLVENKHSGQS